MTSKTTQAGRRAAPTALARVLAFVLLVFVTHSATVEVVHQHGNLLSSSSTVAANVLDANTDHSSTDGTRSTGECLICQLHQHLFSTLIVSVVQFVPPQVEEAFASRSIISSPSLANASQRGRAPPQASLL